MLCNDVAFLTQKSMQGDTVVYVGGSVGAYVLMLANMFPTLKFMLYDHNLSNSVKKARLVLCTNCTPALSSGCLANKCTSFDRDEGFMPSNLQHSPEVFSEQVAAQLLLQDSVQSSRLLLMSDLRNITRNAWGQHGQVAVTDDNVINDLHLQVIHIADCGCICIRAASATAARVSIAVCFTRRKFTDSFLRLLQENWVQLLRPRSAQLKFKLPYHGPSTYSYLKGDMHMQLFGKHSTSEVRLTVDAPLEESDAYPRFMYNRQDHEDCLYHHNFVMRMQHLDSSSRIRISYDQNAAHEIFKTWTDRAIHDVSLSGISDEAVRQDWAVGRIKVHTCAIFWTFSH